MIQDHEGNAPQNATNTHNRGQLCTIHADKTRHCAVSGQVSADTRYGPGEMSRRLALCALLIDRKLRRLSQIAVPCYGAEARAMVQAIYGLNRLHAAHRRLYRLAEWPDGKSSR